MQLPRSLLYLGVFLYTLWILWSGHFDLLLLTLGLLSTLTVLFLTHRMGLLTPPLNVLKHLPCFLAYVPWLLYKIMQSNLDLAWRILNPRRTIKPTWVRLPCTLKTDLGKLIYANSITLTPGTVTLEISDQEIEIHALTEEAALELRAGEMERRVARAVGELR